jgi:hypothetical protein
MGAVILLAVWRVFGTTFSSSCLTLKHYAEFVRELQKRVRRMMESNEGGLEAFSKPANRASSGELLARLAVNRA